jgi:SAM-dependent methyltransferase
VEREWKRYEGTPQRDLFRELRERFLERNTPDGGWAIDVGCGPGRFLPRIGGSSTRRVGFDVSLEMLLSARVRLGKQPPTVPLLRADARRPPIRPRTARSVVVLGNAIGFAGSDATAVVEESAALVAPGGRLVLEIAPGDGERSRYLARLPPGAVRRLLAAPVNLVRARVEREGFTPEARPRASSGFRRIAPSDMGRWLEGLGLAVREMIAVAPALGPDELRIAAVRPDAEAWRRLLEVEEAVGRSAAHLPSASALLVAAERT